MAGPLRGGVKGRAIKEKKNWKQGWEAGKFFSGSGSWFFFKAAPAPAPDFFPKRLRLRFLVLFFERLRLRLQGAKNPRLWPAPAPDY